MHLIFVHAAKVTTWGGQAEDALYVTKRLSENEGRKLEDGEIKDVLERLRRRLLKPNV